MKKLILSSFLVFALLALTAVPAFAQTSTITGTVQSAEVQTDTTGLSTVLVTYTDDLGATQTVRLSVATAESLGLVSTTTDPTTGLMVTTVNDGISGLPLTVNSADVIADPTTTEEAQHPVALKLANLFNNFDYQTIMDYHEQGVGFGVIAQALWLTSGDDSTITLDDLMQAKINNDYSNLTIDGAQVNNWGDVVKALKKGENLGSVMSGKADPGGSSSELTAESSSGESVTGDSSTTHGKSGSHGNNKGNKGKGKGSHGHH